jgi:hypothetical protein
MQEIAGGASVQTQLAVLRLAAQHIDITVSVHRGHLPDGGHPTTAAPDVKACAAADAALLRATLESFEIKDYDLFSPLVSARGSAS